MGEKSVQKYLLFFSTIRLVQWWKMVKFGRHYLLFG